VVDRAASGERVERFDPAALRARRKALGMSLDALAELVATNRQALVAYEQGRRRPGITVLVALAQALGLDPLDLTTATVETATLAELRARVGLTKTELAQRLGLARSTWDLIERGTRTLQPGVGDQVAELLGVSRADVDAAHHRGTHTQG
jgi:transcriptional regulator with XRE-family HTH domain